MSGVNKAIIIGRLGKDPVPGQTSNGKAFCRFSVATSEKFGKGDQAKEVTEWHNITCFDRLAEICCQYLAKGSLAYFEGRITTTKYTDKGGVERYSTGIIAHAVQFLSSKNGGGAGGAEAAPVAEQYAPAQAAPAQQTFDDDDIPF